MAQKEMAARRLTDGTEAVSTLLNVPSLSGLQILESLVRVADDVDKRFTVEMLSLLWQPFEGHYSTFIRDISAGFGLNERPLYHPHEPLHGYNKQHHVLRRELRGLLPLVNMVDSTQLEKIDECEEMLLVSYHIWYNLSSSSHYFERDGVSWLKEKYLRGRGMKEGNEVAQEIVSILKPHQINQSEIPVDILSSQPRDLFGYKNRLFTLSQDVDDYRTNTGRWVDMIWGLGVYTLEPQAIGYVLCNKAFLKQERIKQLLR